MKTIAITIDEDMVERLDKLSEARDGATNRSRIIRQAVREYVEREERMKEQLHETAVFKKNRTKLARQAEALVKDQAKI